MKDLLFFLLLAVLVGTSYLGYTPWPILAIFATIYLVSKIRKHNLQKLKQRKIEQTISCCKEFNIRAEQVNEWFQQPHFQAKENFMDVHPGREAEAIAKHYK